RAEPLGLPEPPPRHVVIDNRSGETLSLLAVTRTGYAGIPGADLGRASPTALDLRPGRYALALGDTGACMPLPVLAPEPGSAPPPTLHVTVWPWPEPDDGWCWIPSGPGLRGDDLGVGREDERPVAAPDTRGFWLAACETTNAQYAAFLNAIGRAAVDAAWLDLGGSKCRVRWNAAARAFETDAPQLPVVTISWPGAVAYCDWRTATTGVPHRLPGEAEWEKAARGPGSRVYAYGDTFRTAAANQESGRLCPVAQYEANGFGLFDMTGNAFEWTADAHTGAPAGDPDREMRMLRGGSFVLDGIFVRNSMRMRLRPGVRADDVGFRVLREAAPGSP
ncbi:MAG TPA: SUMF1/EgtB/PvdO family nonheme iron enzyme, partial [Planctomycetota bacterium]|nr:SUMF1/EgtB/PvdO family nonheme iron enzyme [Planctomycetota bacterium]